MIKVTKTALTCYENLLKFIIFQLVSFGRRWWSFLVPMVFSGSFFQEVKTRSESKFIKQI